MTAEEIFFKTLQLGWIKLGLGLSSMLIAVLLSAILMGISILFNSDGVVAIMFFIWLGLTGIMNFFLNHYIGYLAKAGHVAVIVMAYQTGYVPAKPFEMGKTMVKERFGISDVHFALDKLVAGSIKQLRRTLGRVTNSSLGALPGIDEIKSLTNMFLDIPLGCVDECCLGYTFYHPTQNLYKSAVDGAIIYSQNWKMLPKDATKTTGMIILSFVVVTLIAFILFGGLFRLFGWSGFMAFIISLLLTCTVKSAFIDSWILVKMMSSYMQVAPATQITFDLYGKLSGLSGKFKELLKKGSETPQPNPTATSTAQDPLRPQIPGQAPTPESRSCPQCGMRLAPTAIFCGNCGERL